MENVWINLIAIKLRIHVPVTQTLALGYFSTNLSDDSFLSNHATMI